MAAGLALAALPWFLPAGLARSLAPEWGMALSLLAFVAAGLAAAAPGLPWPRWRRGLFHALLLVGPAVAALSLAPGLTTFCPPLPAPFATFAPWAPLPPALLGAALGAVGRPGLRPAWGRVGWFLLASALFTGLQVYLGPRISPYHPATGKLAFHFSSGGWDASPQAIAFAALTAAAALLLLLAAAARSPWARAAAALTLAAGVPSWLLWGDAWGGGVGLRFRAAYRSISAWPAAAPEVEVLVAGDDPAWVGGPERRLANQLAARAGALARDHRQRLGLPPGPPIKVYLLEEAADEVLWTGVNKVDFVKPWQGALYLSNPQAGTVHLSHELAHAVLGAVGPPPFGVPLNTTVVEGAAVALSEFMDEEEGQWRHVAFAPRLAAGPTEVLGGLSFWTGNFQTSYLRAGGLIGYLLQTRGTEAFLSFYRRPNWASAFGKPPAEALREWGAYLSSLEVPERVRRESAALYARPPGFLEACVAPWSPHLAALAKESPKALAGLYALAEAGADPRLALPGAKDLRTALADRALRTNTPINPSLALEWLGESAFAGAYNAAAERRRAEDFGAAADWVGRALSAAPSEDWRFHLLAWSAEWQEDPAPALAALGALEPSLPFALALRWRGEWEASGASAPWRRATSLYPGPDNCEGVPLEGWADPTLQAYAAALCGPPAATPDTVALINTLPPAERRWLLQRIQGFAASGLGASGGPAAALARLDTIGLVDSEWAQSPALGRIRLLAEALLEVE